MEYNPYKPFILGQEWVPIREEHDGGAPLTWGPTGTVEYGNSFVIPQTRILSEAHLYSEELNPGYAQINVYQQEDVRQAGPVRRVLIPVNNTSMTGTNFAFSNAVDGATALLALNDSKFVSLPFAVNTTPTKGYFRAYFGVNQYSNLLSNKRILYVNLLYAQNTRWEEIVNFYTPSTNSFFGMNIRFSINNGFLNSQIATSDADWTNPGVIRNKLYNYVIDTNLVDAPVVSRVGLGNLTIRSNTPTIFPWNYTDLQRFEISASDRLAIQFDWDTDRGDSTSTSSNVTNQLHYLALEVFYCEETRVAVGGFANVTPTPPEVIAVPLYGLTSKTTNHPLPAGSYVATVGSAEFDELNSLNNALPWAVKGLRQLYAIPTLQSYEIDVPNPYDESIEDKEFTVTTRTIVPQISLHTTGGGVLTEVHPYGNQAKAQVHGTITATQDILDSGLGQARSYPWVRWYARRYGDTRVPLRLTNAAMTASAVQITRNEFDALPEILGGWKEITLRFDSPPSMGAGTNPTWTWSATGELPEDRWEVLGAAAPSISATPGNLLNRSPSFALLGPATYGAPSAGNTIDLSWVPGISPLVATTTADENADAVILFSTDPQTPSNFQVSPTSMALATVNPNCAVNQDCLPRTLSFNALSWQPVSGAAFDDFNRVVASGWGTSSRGDAWTTVGAVASDYLVDGVKGIHRHPAATSSTMITVMNTDSADVDILVKFGVDALESGTASQTYATIVRYQDSSNFYRMLLTTQSNQRDISITRIVAGVSTTLLSVVLPNLTYEANNVYYMRSRASGPNLSVKVWEDSTPEPIEWQVNVVDSTFLTSGWVGWRTFNGSAVGGVMNFWVDDFTVQPADWGATEIQRYDPVDGQFNTIMLCTNPTVTGFSDFEARVGQQSVYRIRNRNVYDFAGLWSPQVTGTIASPGVTGASIGLLLFTSNARQDGSLNLAYSSAWEGAPSEAFAWPEAGQVVLQNMYGKDFPTAFHALERGGEVFSRSILVSAAGIPLVTEQNGFEDLRDMAWASVPYVCVRDELGNRWYSLVTVPDGSRRRIVNKGHLLISTVNVIEVTNTPYPVDP